MALQSVFANDLHFGKQNVDCSQSQDDEREDADLEEGEIAEDDDEMQQESKPTSKISEKESEKKDVKLAHGSEKVELHGNNSKSSGSSKRRDKRNPPNPGSSRARKRAVAENLSDHRDLSRKRRRVQDGDDDAEDGDYDMMNARGHSPLEHQPRYGGDSPGSDYEAKLLVSMQRRQRGEGRTRRISPPRRRGGRGSSRDRGGGGDRRRQDRDHERDRRAVKTNSSSALTVKIKEESICAFYMEGKCSRGSDCPFSHAALPPRKMELCKFYLMDCCAKKEKCLYLHKDFPCKFFHTGKKCRSTAEDCKFSHELLSDTMRAILIKHIETAPREILGDFPRMTRDETIQAIDQFSNPNKREKRPIIPSLFESVNVNTKEAFGNPDLEHQSEPYLNRNDDNGSSSERRVIFYQEIQAPEKDQDREEENSRSIWFGQLRQETKIEERDMLRGPTEHNLDFRSEQEHPHSPPTTNTRENHTDYFSALPARQRQLFRRIQQQQREPIPIQEGGNLESEKILTDEKWHVYSSDEEENEKSISDIFKSMPQKPEMRTEKDACSQLPNLNLSSLENINVAEIAKALSTLQQSQTSSNTTDDVSSESESTSRRDPRKRDPRMRNISTAPTSSMGDVDLRLSTVQLGIPSLQPQDVDLRLISQSNTDVDLRSLAPLGNLEDVGSSDIDLRRLGLPFKPTQHHIPIREFQTPQLQASFSSHGPIEYQVSVVDFTPLDYSSVRVHSEWAHLDPRQQKGRDLSEIRDFTNTDTPSIPLGPASPDPIPPATQSTQVRRYETDSAVRLAPNDPRARRTPSHQQPNQGQEKRGLLGVAPPGMLPFFSRTGDTDSRTGDSNYNNYTSYAERDFDIGRIAEQQTRNTENRRDPRQRLRNSATSQNR